MLVFSENKVTNLKKNVNKYKMVKYSRVSVYPQYNVN